jgi:AraC-like DNA-binding protein
VGRYQLRWDPVDPLGEALHTLHLAGTFYCRSELTQPWGLAMPAMPGCVWFHALLSGRCDLVADSLSPVALAPGGFALITKGQGHVLRTGPSVATPDVLDLPHEMAGERYALLRYGGGGAASTLICGVVRFHHHAAHDLIRLLPPIICVDSLASLESDWMQSTLQLMAHEARQQAPGGETIVTRLADILVIQAIRSWLNQDPAAKTGWLGALQDRQVGRALAMIHREPANDWSVGSLATVAAMSRSGFAARFAALVGQTPMHYVTKVRMQAAKDLLTTDRKMTIGELATRLGYQSEAAFNRTFKRFNGTTPGASRRGDST